MPGLGLAGDVRERVELYQRSRIGFNVHWNEYGLGNQRLYHLPANGVMQICDCADSLAGSSRRIGRSSATVARTI